MTSNASVSFRSPDADGEINLSEYFDILLDNKWLIASFVTLALFVGVAYALFARPIYEGNLTLQVEDSDKSAGSFLGDAASSLLSVKTPAAGEIEVVRSRLILGQAIENTKLYINARPKLLPVFGNWLARRATDLSNPGLFGGDGYVFGSESINVPQLEVPAELEGTQFVLTLGDGKNFEVDHEGLSSSLSGEIGKLVTGEIGTSKFKLLVSSISGKPGAKFLISANSKLLTTLAVQDQLKVVEKGRQSGVLDVSWESTDPFKLTELLNEIGRLYVRQNIDRKAAEAEKTLGFLSTELPRFKRQLEASEDLYNKYRNQNGTISLDDEARNALAQTVDLQGKLIDAQQRRRELLSRFTDQHPSVQTLDAQIKAWSAEIAAVDLRIRKMPLIQQNTVQMQRDIKVNTDLYVTLLNNSLQLRLAKEGKVGNVRLLDAALVPEKSVKPQKSLIVVLSLVLGFVAGVVAAIIRSTFFSGIRSPNEIEAHTGLNVYSTIPLSAGQKSVDKNIANKMPGAQILAVINSEDPAIESLRSLRTALQFAMLDAENNRLVITGGTPGVGKTFVSVNFAALVAAAGKRVLLIDADLRKGRVNQYFGLRRAAGLSELIVGSMTLDEVTRSQVFPNLDVITTGVLPPNPGELFVSSSFTSLLGKLSALYDLVIIDTAPVLVASDTVSIAPFAGTLLLIARAEKTQLGEINESVRRLSQVGSRVNGLVFNAMDLTRRHYGSYSYKYGGYRYVDYKYQSNHSG